VSAYPPRREVSTTEPGPSFEGSAGARIRELEECIEAIRADCKFAKRLSEMNSWDEKSLGYEVQASDTLSIIERYGL